MAQLIKLQDYISRYESNIYQYPSQYIRLKQENWNKMLQLYENGLMEEDTDEEDKEESVPSKGWKRLFNKRKSEDNEEVGKMEPTKGEAPQTLLELKKYFLDGLHPFQLKWASTTLREKSFVDRDYHYDERLKYYLQRFPDTYFLMYHPIVKIKNAKMEAETILIGPYGIEIIYYLEVPGGSEVEPTSEKSWIIEKDDIRSKILSPLIALKRTETFVKSVLQTYHIDFPFRKVVLAPELMIKESQEPFQTDYIGEREYPSWLHEKRHSRSPLKHMQLKAAEALLKHSQTTSVRRPEWEEEEEFREG